MSTNLMQQLNSIPNVGGGGIPVQQYTSTMKQVLTAQMTAEPNSELSTLSTTTNALDSLQSALQQLQTATQSLTSSQSWESINATSSNTSAFTVTASGGALPGNFSVTNISTAQNQIDVAQNTQTSTTGTTTLTGGTFNIFAAVASGTGSSQTWVATGTALATITVTAGESLSDIVTAVNKYTSSSHVQAFLLGNSLAFESTQSGASGAFTLTDTGGGNLVSSQLGMKQTQPPADASITLAGTTVTSSTNTFSNVIPGVTITVQQSGTSGTLNLTQDTSNAQKNVQNWMNAYNNVVDLLNKDTLYTPAQNGNPAQSGPLIGDATATGLLSQLPNSVVSVISGVQSKVDALSKIGIVLDPNTGHLEFQSSSGFTINGKTVSSDLKPGTTTFQDALSSNLSDVENLFGVFQTSTLTSAIPTTGILGQLNDTLNQYLGSGSNKGVIPTELKSISDQQKSINKYLQQINQMIANQVSDFTSQLNQLNASLQQTQAQMQTISALFGGSASSQSSTANTVNSASLSGA